MSKVTSARVSPAPSVNGASPRRWARADMACSVPVRGPPSARSTCASRRPPWATPATAPSASWPGRMSTTDSLPPASEERRSANSRALPSWSMPSASHTTMASEAPVSADVIAGSAAMRSGANGCGCTAAAVERAAAGASTLRLSAFVGLAVGTISTGRLLPSASAISRSIMKVRAPHCAADDQPLSTTSTTGPEPDSAFSLLGLSTGSASARMTSAAASMRIRVSHQGVWAGVFSRFSMPTRMRVGGNSRRRGRGGMVRSSHQITGRAIRPASSHGLRKAIGPSVMTRLPRCAVQPASRASSGSRRPCPAGA